MLAFFGQVALMAVVDDFGSLGRPDTYLLPSDMQKSQSKWA